MSAVPVRFEGIELSVRPDARHEWLLSNAEAAAGMGTTEDHIRQIKRRRESELVEGKHFISVTERHGNRGNPNRTMWTKRGIVRLGFWVRSERAVRFRDFAEDLVVAETSKVPERMPTHAEALRGWASEIERREAAEAKAEALEPSAAAWDRMAEDATTDFSVREAAQMLSRDPGISIGQNRLFSALRKHGWIDRRNVPYQNQVNAGRLVLRTYEYTDRTGATKPGSQVRVTLKGLRDLHQFLGGTHPLALNTQLRLIEGTAS